MFQDQVTITCVAGKGGNGVVAWTRAKYIPKGGPCGGNGGRGGHIYLVGDHHLNSLEQFEYPFILKAEDGCQGGANKRQGRHGKDLIIKLPCGTIIRDHETKAVICDLTDHQQEFLVCKGGRGGRGNDSFKTPTNRAPAYASQGSLGQELRIDLELKLIADVGLVGFPNAGKSTLLNAFTEAKVKTAAYPFTTLAPNLGRVELGEQSFTIADIPGIIEGAHLNKGLGLSFLRHIDRTRVLWFVLDSSCIDGRTPTADFKVIMDELEKFNPELLNRPSMVILNKVDQDGSAESIQEFKNTYNIPVYEVSALEKEGLEKILQDTSSTLNKIKNAE